MSGTRIGFPKYQIEDLIKTLQRVAAYAMYDEHIVYIEMNSEKHLVYLDGQTPHESVFAEDESDQV